MERGYKEAKWKLKRQYAIIFSPLWFLPFEKPIIKMLQWHSPLIICAFDTVHEALGPGGSGAGDHTGRPQTGFGPTVSQTPVPLCSTPPAVCGSGQGQALEPRQPGSAAWPPATTDGECGRVLMPSCTSVSSSVMKGGGGCRPPFVVRIK